MTNGSVYFTLNSGKVVGPFSGVLDEVSPKEGYYLDVTKGGKDYPSRLDFKKFKKVVNIIFKPGVGKKQTWTSWTYFNHGQWKVDRFTKLG